MGSGRGSLMRAAALALSLALLDARAAVPCSLISSGIGEPVLGADGRVHWTASGGWATAGRRWPDSAGAFWVTQTSLGGDPEAVLIGLPGIREGHPSLVGALPDGSSWWRTPCTDWDPPTTVACYSLLLAGPVGEPLGRVSTPRSGRLYLESDGTLLSLRVAGGPPARPRGATGRPPRRRLQLWRGTPQPLSTFDQAADNDWWDDDYERRVARWPQDGWDLVWEAPLPFLYRDFDRAIWTLSPEALHGGDPLVAAVVSRREGVLAGVYSVRIDSGSDPAARLDVLWEREFPHARNGLPENEEGELALAPPWSIALSSRGELALGNWAIHGDCSKDRPAGFVVLDDDGVVLADVHDDETQGRIDGLTFDRADRLVVARAEISTYSARGDLLGTAPRTPTVWEEEEERLRERARALTDTSPLEEWAELYRVVQSLQNDEGEPETELQRLADRLLVQGWSRIEHLLSDDAWHALGQRLCAAHPEAPQAALRRFEAAWGENRKSWLRMLPACFEEPPASALALAREWLEKRDSDRRRAARHALAQWPAPTDLLGELWERVVAAESTSDYDERYRATEKRHQLLAALADQRPEVEARLRAGGDQRKAAISVLFSSFAKFRPEHVASEDAPSRDALLEAARHWVEADDEDLKVIGSLLLIGHDAWDDGGGAAPRESSPKPEASTRAASPIDHILLAALEGQGSQGDELPLWAALAVSRLLQRHATRSPTDLGWLEQVPTPERMGLRADLVTRLLAAVTAVAGAGQADRRFPPHSGLERARHVLLRSLGEHGREMLLAELRQLEPAWSALTSIRLAELVSWMAEDVASWDEADVRFVLHLIQSGLHDGWSSGPILDAVARAYPEDHELSRMARSVFRGFIEEAVAAAGDSGAFGRGRRGPSRALSLGHVISHLVDGDAPARRLSPLLTELTLADVETLAGGATSGFEPWLPLMNVTGPWPAAVPELGRMLEGNHNVEAALVLSHLQHPQALDVLLAASRAFGYARPTLAEALARYGAEGVERLVQRLASPPGDSHQSRLEVGAAQRILVELMRTHPDLVREVATGEGFVAARANVRAAVDGALERGRWPDGESILWLDVFDRDPSDWTSPRAASHDEGVDSPLGRTLAALDSLPTDANSLRAFLFRSGTGVSSYLLQRLAELASDADHPLRDAALAVVRPLAEEGVHEARWVVRQVETPRRGQ